MRSRRHVGQGSLFDDPDAGLAPLADGGAPPSVARAAPGARRRTEQVAPGPQDVHVVTGREFARRGWPAGTRLHLEAATRADRGTLVMVEDGGRVLVGDFGLDRGRPALLTDLGSTWLSARARVVAVVTAVEAPLTA